MGVAVIDRDRTLLHYGVCTFARTGTHQDRLAAIVLAVAQLSRHYKPTLIAVEKTYIGGNGHTALLNAIEGAIVALAKKKRIRVVRFAANTVKKQLCGSGAASKRAVAKKVVCHYPQLKIYLHQPLKWMEQFHANMFDAVALGLVAKSGKSVQTT